MRKFLFGLAAFILCAGIVGWFVLGYVFVHMYERAFLIGTVYVIAIYVLVRFADLCLDRIIDSGAGDFEPLLPRRQWRPDLSVFRRLRRRNAKVEVLRDTPRG